MLAVKPVFLVSDLLLWGIALALVLIGGFASRSPQIRRAWSKVLASPMGFSAFIVVLIYSGVGLLDSFHFRAPINNPTSESTHYQARVESVLDRLLLPYSQDYERTYSAPLATVSYVKETRHDLRTGEQKRLYPPLRHAGRHLDTQAAYWHDVTLRCLHALVITGIAIAVSLLFLILLLAWHTQTPWRQQAIRLMQGQTTVAWRSGLWVIFLLIACIALIGQMRDAYHPLGTDKVGQDVLYAAIKSIRTGLIIGSVTTLILLPFAVLLGAMAGFFGGRIDDIIQYIYTTLSSIPGVLLIAAAVLSLQIYIDNHPDAFPTLAAKSDARLVALCCILGVTSWTGLCRVLRAEVLKLRELDYLQAGRALGGKWYHLIAQHILPNVFHLILIAVVLDFSQLVLAEAVLTYVGVGVDPTTYSWGNMIDGARLELAREPIVWWPLFASFSFMFVFVLAINLFADSLREAFDPRHAS